MVWYLVGGYTISAVFEGCSRGYLQPPPASLVPHGYKRLTVFDIDLSKLTLLTWNLPHRLSAQRNEALVYVSWRGGGGLGVYLSS